MIGCKEDSPVGRHINLFQKLSRYQKFNQVKAVSTLSLMAYFVEESCRVIREPVCKSKLVEFVINFHEGSINCPHLYPAAPESITKVSCGPKS
jgi:hypothetical protein